MTILPPAYAPAYNNTELYPIPSVIKLCNTLHMLLSRVPEYNNTVPTHIPAYYNTVP